MLFWNVAWLNQNSQRSYPLADDASGMDTSGSARLPDNFLLDFVFPVQNTTSINPKLFHVHTVQIFQGGVTVAFGYDGDVVASVSVPAGHEYGEAYYVQGAGDFSDSTGIVAIGELSDLPGGQYSFDAAAGRLSPATIRPNIRGVSAVRVVQGRSRSELMTGDIELVSGSNVQFAVTPTETGYRVRINAVFDGSAQEACECDTLSPKGEPIYSINGVTPVNGNIDLVPVDDCIEIEPDTEAGVIRFRNTCAEACCGCEELEVIVNDAQSLATEVRTLSGIASRLEAEVAKMRMNLLASKIGRSPTPQEPE